MYLTVCSLKCATFISSMLYFVFLASSVILIGVISELFRLGVAPLQQLLCLDEFSNTLWGEACFCWGISNVQFFGWIKTNVHILLMNSFGKFVKCSSFDEFKWSNFQMFGWILKHTLGWDLFLLSKFKYSSKMIDFEWVPKIRLKELNWISFSRSLELPKDKTH